MIIHFNLSVISIGEVCKGFTVHPEEHRRVILRKWLDETLRPWFADGSCQSVKRSLSFGVLEGQCQLRGLAVSAPDGIAATALEHNLTIVTRNVKDFAGLGAMVF